MHRDHKFFIGRYHPRRHAALSPSNAGTTFRIRVLIQFEPEPTRVNADPAADRSGVLTDASGEHERMSLEMPETPSNPDCS